MYQTRFQQILSCINRRPPPSFQDAFLDVATAIGADQTREPPPGAQLDVVLAQRLNHTFESGEDGKSIARPSAGPHVSDVQKISEADFRPLHRLGDGQYGTVSICYRLQAC